MPLPIRLLILVLLSTNFAFANHHAQQSIFNGKDLTGWSGSPDHWSVKNGTITGHTTPENELEVNTFLIWENEVSDFEFTAEFKLTGETANSGIQYRSKVLDADKWIAGGYQADMDYQNRYTGMLYEERGRGIIIRPGIRATINPGHTTKKPQLTSLGEGISAEEHKAAIKKGEWNKIRIVAKGNHLKHFINGVLTAEGIDTDPKHAASSGALALQLHRGPPMTVQFRNIKLKELP
ncbi:MAG: DUF1080 domain-containing protein [Synoicihabitans sp.]